MRSDLPAQLFDQLLARASEKVRSKLQAEREFAKADINGVVGEVTERIQVNAATQPIRYAAAQVLAESMHRAGQLTAGKLQEFAATGRFEEVVAALSVMSNVPTAIIEQNMRDSQAEASSLPRRSASPGKQHAASWYWRPSGIAAPRRVSIRP